MSLGFQKENNKVEIRLNKYLSDSGICSRREADRLIESGRVSVDGICARQGMKIMHGQKVSVDGKTVFRDRELILLAVNKPRGVVCTSDKKWDDRTIYDLLNYPKRIFSAGRLDKESEGLLLMTNDGDLMDQMMRARNEHEKEYLVTIDRPVTSGFLKKMSSGVFLEELNVRTRPCRVMMTGEKQFRIILTQGLNRQIRRMCEVNHCTVNRLQRVRIMNIELGNLKPGEYRSVTRKELAELKNRLNMVKGGAD